MKKQSFLFIAGAVLTLASCQSDTNDNGASQAQIDSTVNARVEEMRMQMMAQNDSIINAEAQRRADSMFAEMKGGSTAPVAAAPRATKPATTKPATPAKPVTSESKWNDNNSKGTTSKSKWDEPADKNKKEATSKSKWE